MSDKTADKVTPSHPPFKDGSSSFGSFYPKHYVLSVFNSDAEAATAAEALRSAGFGSEDVIVASGRDVVTHEADQKAKQGIFSKIGEQWSKLYTDESTDSNTLVEFANRGAAFVLVYAPEDDQVMKAAGVLRPMHPGVLRNYGSLAITELG